MPQPWGGAQEVQCARLSFVETPCIKESANEGHRIRSTTAGLPSIDSSSVRHIVGRLLTLCQW